MHKNKNCFACIRKLDKDYYKKNRTVCKDCYSKKKRKNNDNILIENQQPKIDIGNNNNRSTFFVGSSFSCKTYLMLKTLSRIHDRDINY